MNYLNKIDLSKLKRNYIEYPFLGYEYPTKSDMNYLYNELKLSNKFLEQYFNITHNQMTNILKKYKLRKGSGHRPVVSEIDISKLSRDYYKYPLVQNDFYPYKEDLQYLFERCTLKELSDFFKTPISTIQKWLRKFGIKKSQEAKNKYMSELFIFKAPSKEELEHLYIKQNKSYKELSRVYNVSETTIWKWIHNYQLFKPRDIVIQNRLQGIMNKYGVNCVFKLEEFQNLSHITSSKYESEINKIFGNIFETHNRTILDGKEIDLFYNNLGIEFNGDYWHSTEMKSETYHKDKSDLARNKNIFLFHIFEYEWNNDRKKPIIISMIRNLLNINTNKIYARKCEIKEVNNKEASDFLDNNHIQGKDISTIRIGLYYNNELVSLMTFCKPKFNKQCEYELSRFVNKKDTSVIGGASKLFKYFIKSYSPKSIVSYSDCAKTKGNLYNKLGFIKIKENYPNYIWTDLNGTVLTRYQCQKKTLLKQGYHGNTEKEIMQNRNYIQIFDSGSYTWIWKIN